MGNGRFSGLPVATFHCDAPANCCALAGGQTIVAGDGVGRLHILRIEERPAEKSAKRTLTRPFFEGKLWKDPMQSGPSKQGLPALHGVLPTKSKKRAH